MFSAFGKTLVCTSVVTVLVPCTGFPCDHSADGKHSPGRGKLHWLTLFPIEVWRCMARALPSPSSLWKGWLSFLLSSLSSGSNPEDHFCCVQVYASESFLIWEEKLRKWNHNPGNATSKPQCFFQYGNFGNPEFKNNLVLGIFELKTLTGRLRKYWATKINY